MKNIRIEIDSNKCLGCEICTTICQDMFTSADKGLVSVRFNIIPESLVGRCYEAEDCCPSQAISLVSPNLWE